MLKSFLLSLLYTGTASFAQQPEIAIRVMLTNCIAMIAILVSVSLAVVATATGNWMLIVPQIICASIFLGVILANKYQRITAARNTIVLSSLLLIVVYSWLFGSGVGLDFFVLSVAGVSFLLFRMAEYRYIVAGVVGSFITHLFLYAASSWWEVGYLNLPSQTLSAMTLAYWITCFPSSVIPFALFLYLTKHYENALESSRERLGEVSRLGVVGEMAGIIAHEINNPLTIIIGRTHLLTKKVEANKATPRMMVKFLTEIKNTAVQISEISATLSRMGHVSNEDTNSRQSIVSISQIVNDLVHSYAFKFKLANVRVAVDVADEDVLGARLEITQVLINILDNAFHALKEVENGRVDIVGNRSVTGYEVCISNNGSLISSAVANRIFEPYFTTKEIGKGTGLGLSICRKIMELNHGFIELRPDAKRTTFVLRFSLPQQVKAVA